MFQATGIEIKIREINLLIDMQINLTGTKSVSSTHVQNF